MQCLVFGFFLLIFGVSSKLTPGVVNKKMRISEIFLREVFKVRPYDRTGALMAGFLLCPLELDDATEK